MPETTTLETALAALREALSQLEYLNQLPDHRRFALALAITNAEQAEMWIELATDIRRATT